jgi:single-stranded-DNA-specific exonuclease
MPKRWQVRPHDSGQIARLEREAGVSAVVAQLLICRGICDPHTARVFLDPKLNGLREPDELPGLPAAADRIIAAIAARKPIVIYGDYDCDGMTATAILLRCLRLLGAEVSFYVPNRIDEGYGLNDDALRTLASRGAKMIVTVDCGIASVREAQTALELGLELIVTDHHEMAAELPAAAAIVHPRLPGHNYPFTGLSGAGVAFKLAWALCQRKCQAKRVTDGMRAFLLQAVGIAALGTVADIVPLVDENRILVHHGLQSLKHRPVLGIEALMKLTKLTEKQSLGCEDIGFTLGPRLNAAGRLGQAQLGVELLTTESTERASALAEYLHELNSSRDSLERSIYLAANKQLQERCDLENDAALVLAAPGWHAGVIGIVAGRLSEKHHRPVAIIAQDELGVKPGIGSVRGAPGYLVHEGLAACTHLLLSHGGHAAAGGLKILDGHIDAFREAFCEDAAQQISAEMRIAELTIDCETLLASLTLNTVEQIERLAPFGEGNRRPLLCASNVRLSEPPKKIGSSGRHLSMRVEQHGARLRGVSFGNGDWADELTNITGPLNLAFRPVINSFNGRRSVELHVADWRVAETAAVVGAS